MSLLLAAACSPADGPTTPEIPASFASMPPGSGTVLLCKWTQEPTNADFDFSVTATGGQVNGGGSFTLNATQQVGPNPECATVWQSTDDSNVQVTITESPGLGWEVWQVFISDVGFVPAVDNAVTVTANSTTNIMVIFKNQPVPISMLPGRMTGGGGQIIVGPARITRGFTIHCDITLSNNIEINWPGHRWHLDKPITSALCEDDPNVEPAPPPAPFDTFHGEATGRLNNVDGSFLRFTFVDGGEPGGSVDYARITIWAPGANPAVDAPVLVVDQPLDHGNLQAHYDQPHK